MKKYLNKVKWTSFQIKNLSIKNLPIYKFTKASK
jgi:hypothetical protein